MKKQLSIFYSVGAATLGLIIIGLFFAIQTNTINTYNKNLPYISLGDNLKNKVTKGHLWFEEYMAGDKSIQFEEDVVSLFQNSQEILKAALNGEATELGEFYPTNDEQIKKYIKGTVTQLDQLIEFTQKRKDFKDEFDKKLLAAQQDSSILVGSTGEEAGGEMDQAFDKSYDEVQASLDDLILYIDKEVKEDVSFLTMLTYLVLLFILIIFIISSFIVYRIQRKNEVASAEGEKKLAEETNRINIMTRFVDSIVEGNYQESLDIDNKDDKLAQSLVTMKENLHTMTQDEKKRHWINEGVGKLNDILRKNHDQADELYHQVMKFVVEYTDSNQGGIFILNQETNEAQMVSCYAYGRKKFLEKTIAAGEGLVGQCLLEKEIIFLTEIPDKYVSITSGLGHANPRALIVVPLKVNDEVYGVLEMASFRPYEEHKCKLIETMAEVIASTVYSLQANEQTKILLEQAQHQTEEMRAQEEEMRQNMEELSATQEELARKEKDYIQTIKELRQQLQQSDAEIISEQE